MIRSEQPRICLRSAPPLYLKAIVSVRFKCWTYRSYSSSRGVWLQTSRDGESGEPLTVNLDAIERAIGPLQGGSLQGDRPLLD